MIVKVVDSIKREYVRPCIALVVMEGTRFMDGLNSNFQQSDTGVIDVFLDEEKARPEEALGKRHTGIWEDYDETY